MATHMPVTENTLIAIKVTVNESTKKLKLPLKDLGADKLIPKLRHLLLIRPAQDVVFERYSDSVAGYVTLDPTNPAVFKTLVRAAKAKLKLRLRANVSPLPGTQEKDKVEVHAPVVVTRTAGGPVVVPVRGSTAFDQRSVGPGIFQFREPPSPEKSATTAESDEAPVPGPFTTPTTTKAFFAELAAHGLEQELALRAKGLTHPSSWSVYCNECDAAMDNAHFHCSVCDGGDYDLCQSCIDGGKLCPGEGHWLIKRSFVDGKIVASTTERLAPKPRLQSGPLQTIPVEIEKIENISAEREMPGAFTDDTRTLSDEVEGPFRTCNNCIIGLPDHEFVTCAKCDDFDLCRRCYVADNHGHHPAHHFEPAVGSVKLSLAEEALLAPGRNIRHNAICDGCDENIYGIRHKCFSCPDFDYCNNCVKDARHTHPRHRFAPIYEPIALARGVGSASHHGIYCDGPLCKDKPFQAYIHGVRYKCVVCHDLDFCASCEALPGNSHNKTHPLIKFKTPVNNVSISTQNEDKNGKVRNLGDRRPFAVAPSKPTTNVTTSVKTVADIKPSQKAINEEKPATLFANLPIRNLQDEAKSTPSAPLEAHFVQDSVVDGTVIAPDTRFTQVWTLHNPGPRTWPAGCSVRFVGGDNMLNVDNTRPSSVSDINEATESNVIGREVQPGEEVAFKILLKAPSREGKSISYWRIKAADGTPFGHKLWCDVEVKKLELEAPTKSGVPAVSSKAPTAAQQHIDHASMAQYWAGYQQRMAAIRLANAQRQAALQRNHESRAAHPTWAAQAQMEAAATYQANADWRRQMEEFVRCTNSSSMPQPAASDDVSKADMTVKAVPVPVNTTPEAVVQEQESELKDSQMIFPTLERESPCSSTYESLGSSATGKAAFVEDERTGVKLANATLDSAPSSAAAPAPAQESDQDTFEDISSELEVLSADGGAESDDGFMTDEEYDILDASDQETVASK